MMKKTLALALAGCASDDAASDEQATGGTSPTDARVVQELQGGVATGVISVPLRYMHTPSEVVSLADIQATIDLVCEYCRRLRPDTDFTPM